ncbi:hypothetical protein BT93_J0840 [Corymbia citriodora subsp. variegata]|nr:hypothetical protein BT93_J0840 [Corymbia citriodora subsp. variegata]
MESAVAASPAVIKVAAICGSLRKASFNRGLLRSAVEISQQSANGMRIELIDVSPLPMINTDLEVDGRFPPAVEAFRQKVLEADSILFASPEYNYSVARNHLFSAFYLRTSSLVCCARSLLSWL